MLGYVVLFWPITLPIKTLIMVNFYFYRMLVLNLAGEKGKEHHQKLIDPVMLSLLEQWYTSELVGLKKCTPMIAPVKSGLNC